MTAATTEPADAAAQEPPVRRVSLLVAPAALAAVLLALGVGVVIGRGSGRTIASTEVITVNVPGLAPVSPRAASGAQSSPGASKRSRAISAPPRPRVRAAGPSAGVRGHAQPAHANPAGSLALLRALQRRARHTPG